MWCLAPGSPAVDGLREVDFERAGISRAWNDHRHSEVAGSPRPDRGQACGRHPAPRLADRRSRGVDSSTEVAYAQQPCRVRPSDGIPYPARRKLRSARTLSDWSRIDASEGGRRACKANTPTRTKSPARAATSKRRAVLLGLTRYVYVCVIYVYLCKPTVRAGRVMVPPGGTRDERFWVSAPRVPHCLHSLPARSNGEVQDLVHSPPRRENLSRSSQSEGCAPKPPTRGDNVHRYRRIHEAGPTR